MTKAAAHLASLLVPLLLPATPPLSPGCEAAQLPRTWSTRDWCSRVVRPDWPFAYSKHPGQVEEPKGRTSTNLQDVRHACDARGVRSKCHVCEDVACRGRRDSNGRDGDDGGRRPRRVCRFQLQGVRWEETSRNVPTVADVPWAVGGAHRYDLGGPSTTHACLHLSGPRCQSSLGEDYSECALRCWGWGNGMSGSNATAGYATRTEGEEPDGTWPNHRRDSADGVRSTPWEAPMPTMAWNYPRHAGVGDAIPRNPNSETGGRYEFNPQGFVFTMAGSEEGEEGFSDGVGSDAR